jgi:hypothetical protein
MLNILFVFILVRSPEPYVGAIARPRDFAVPLWSECSAHDERPKHGERKCQLQSRGEVGVNARIRLLGRNCQREDFVLRQVFEILRHRPPGYGLRKTRHYFFPTPGLGEAGVAATWTVVPVVRESEGLTITLSDSETPLRISD